MLVINFIDLPQMETSNAITIVGGGLAGLTAAIHLSKIGYSVTLIEKNSYPKHKVCGEYISNEVLSYLNKKYTSEYFVFINQLDIKNDMSSYDINTDSYQREVVVHYSILDITGKTINAGIATSRFSSKENNPKKIVAQCFSPIATYIAAKFTAIANPKPAPQKN